ncbi:MAG TPA: hypothetical protein VJQ48_11025 [Candidatus Binatia bacterium]|nr:hypothetical protein [Candidatus Binatia bacterium]
MGPENKEIDVVLRTSTAAESAAVLVREISLGIRDGYLAEIFAVI